MATNVDVPERAESRIRTRPAVAPAVALLLGWLLPGAGHLLLRRWVRGALLFCSIVAMFAIGLGLQGKVFSPATGDPLDILGFAGQLGSGSLYLLARLLDLGHATVQVAIADYGTKFLVVAGLLNVIAAVDAHSLANGRKPRYCCFRCSLP